MAKVGRGGAMKVTEKDVGYVAQLAHLELTQDEQASMVRDLNAILDHVDRLSELDTAGVQPMAQVFGGTTAGQSQAGDSARDDIVQGLRPSLTREEALANAPDTDGTFFLVPKVIDRG
jgi:aspartyl-tRNA(Asn)/glutamyl-tRNA(Gln) amidotransferase subunit C